MSDMRSRQAILKHIEKIRQGVQMMDDTHRASIIMNGMYLCEKAVRNQPSAQPEIIRCKDCKYGGYNPARPNKYYPCDMAFPAHWRCYYYKKFKPIVTQDGFCNKAERRTDEL